jgi:hypothetical protein
MKRISLSAVDLPYFNNLVFNIPSSSFTRVVNVSNSNLGMINIKDGLAEDIQVATHLYSFLARNPTLERLNVKKSSFLFCKNRSSKNVPLSLIHFASPTHGSFQNSSLKQLNVSIYPDDFMKEMRLDDPYFSYLVPSNVELFSKWIKNLLHRVIQPGNLQKLERIKIWMDFFFQPILDEKDYRYERSFLPPFPKEREMIGLFSSFSFKKIEVIEREKEEALIFLMKEIAKDLILWKVEVMVAAKTPKGTKIYRKLGNHFSPCKDVFEEKKGTKKLDHEKGEW